MATAPAPSVTVTVFASRGIHARYRYLMMWVEFEPGLRFRLSPGANQFLLPPGHYDVRFWSPYVWMSVGTARIAVDLRPGTPVELSYATPATIYGHGKADFGSALPPPTPVRKYFFWIRIAIVVVALLVILGLLVTR